MSTPDPIAIAELGGCPEIDVHGYDVHGAIFEISAFASRAQASGHEVVKILHGRGSGVLRAGLLAWAKKAGYRVQDSTVPFETGAVLYLCQNTSLKRSPR